MRKVIAALTMLLSVLASIASSQARVVINVDKSTQRMTVSVNGVPNYSWDVSTGRENFGTPTGQFTPQRLARTWYSSKYYNSPMPYSIFFHKGYAIHGSYEISRLGGPASHGCIRLHPQNAATLFSLVQAAGPGNTTILVSGDNPGTAYAARRTWRSPFSDARADNFYYRSRPEPFVRRGYVYQDNSWEDWGGPRYRSGWR